MGTPAYRTNTRNSLILGKPQIHNPGIGTDMSDDRLAELHELLKNPIRQKILLKLGAHDR